MVDVTKLRPHAVVCIKKSVFNLLSENSGDNLTVSCDRHDCWDDDELFKHKAAINVATGVDQIGAAVKGPRGKVKSTLANPRPAVEFECEHEAILNIDVTAYVEACDAKGDCQSGADKAYSVVAHAIQILTSNQSEVLGRRILYRGSTPQTDVTGDADIEVVTARFQVHYIFDQTRPWVVGKGE